MSKLDNFKSALEENGDLFFSTGDEDKDLMQVLTVLEVQGYWAGGNIRYYFDEELNVTKTEERKFG